jgi:hypothetical protein
MALREHPMLTRSVDELSTKHLRQCENLPLVGSAHSWQHYEVALHHQTVAIDWCLLMKN